MMRKKARRKTILIDGIRYYDDKPDTCRKCFFWKNRKVGCVLGTQNCYYLAEAVKTEQEKKTSPPERAPSSRIPKVPSLFRS